MESDRIGQRLLGAGLVTAAELQGALALQAEMGGLLGLLLVRIGAVSESDLLAVLSQQLGLPVLTLDAAPPSEAIAGALAASPVSLAWWTDHQAVVWWDEIAGEGPRLVCAAVNPLDLGLREQVERIGGEDVRMNLAGRTLVESLLQGAAHLSETAAPTGLDSADPARLRELAQETPVIDFVNSMFAQALALRASDVHIEPYETQFLVRMRVDGVLTTLRQGPRASFDAICSRIKLLSGMDIGERRLPQDGRQSIRVSGQALDLRVSTLPCSWGESLVLRLLGKSSRLPELQEMGLDEARADQLVQLARSPNGLILVTGPTGSGKTTTIYRLLQVLNDGVRKIVTVEDPVEFDLPGVVQVHVRSEIGLSFATGLRSILRQDPDVIMVGEIRDAETARIAVQAALTGHLVISTVHTNSALAAAPRLLDLGVEPFLLASVLRGLVGQRLVRRLCEACAMPSSAEQRRTYEALRPAGLTKAAAPGHWREPVGCPRCAGAGYLGRMALFDLVAASPVLERAVRQQASEEELAQILAAGHIGLIEDGFNKAAAGLTTLAEVRQVAGDSSGAAARTLALSP